MARTFFDRRTNLPIFSIERGVGVGMSNDRDDVLLVQYLLKAMFDHRKAAPGVVMLAKPSALDISLSGAWDEASKIYLGIWEASVTATKLHHMSAAPGPWPWSLTDPHPGKVVPVTKGGKKIINMCSFCVQMFGKPAFAKLELPNVSLPAELARTLFHDT